MVLYILYREGAHCAHSQSHAVTLGLAVNLVIPLHRQRWTRHLNSACGKELA